jgi:hypothetical protein
MDRFLRKFLEEDILNVTPLLETQLNQLRANLINYHQIKTYLIVRNRKMYLKKSI